MYIKLIQPKMKKRPMDTDIKTHMAPPLGLLTIANMVRNEHRVVLENENIEDIHYDAPDIVGISITVDVLPRAIEIAKKFKEQGIWIVNNKKQPEKKQTIKEKIPSLFENNKEKYERVEIKTGASDGEYTQIITNEGRRQMLAIILIALKGGTQ